MFDPIAVLKAKQPQLWHRLRPWQRSLLRWVLGLLAMNSRLEGLVRGLEQLEGRAFVQAVLGRMAVRIGLQNGERIPQNTALTVVANHPSGIMDGLLLLWLGSAGGQRCRLAVNDTLAKVPQLAASFLPVDRFSAMAGSPFAINRQTYQELVNMYRQREPVLVFPAGRTARMGAGTMKEFPWEKGFVKMSRLYGRTIVPVKIHLKSSRFFNWIWKLRRLFSIDANLEMFLLVAEFFRLRGARIVLTVGHPLLLEAAKPIDDGPLAQALRRSLQPNLREIYRVKKECTQWLSP